MISTVVVVKGGDWKTIKQREGRQKNWQKVAGAGGSAIGLAGTGIAATSRMHGSFIDRHAYEEAARAGKRFKLVRGMAKTPKGMVALGSGALAAGGLGLAATGGIGSLHEGRKIKQRRKANAARAGQRQKLHDDLQRNGIRRDNSIFMERLGPDGEILQTHSGYRYDRGGKIQRVGKAAPKLTPVQRDQKNLERAKGQKRQAQFGLANNAFGAAAGGLATAQAYRSAPKTVKELKATKMGGRLVKLNRTKIGHKILKPMRKLGPRGAVLAGGAGLVGMQLANAGMDAQSGAYFARQSVDTAKKQKRIEARIERRAAKTGTPVVAAKSYEQMYDVVVHKSAGSGLGRNLLMEDVSKKVRRFDPEGDRQRRLGVYQGAGMAGALGLGGAAGVTGWGAGKAGHKQWKALSEAQRQTAGKLGRRAGVPLALLAGATASGGLGLAAHRQANSARNQRWT